MSRKIHISFEPAPPSCAEREGRIKFKIQIYVSNKI